MSSHYVQQMLEGYWKGMAATDLRPTEVAGSRLSSAAQLVSLDPLPSPDSKLHDQVTESVRKAIAANLLGLSG